MTAYGALRDDRINRERAMRNHVQSQHRSAWIEVAAVAILGLAAWWITNAPWLAVFIAVIWSLKALLREAVNLQSILLGQSIVTDTHHLRSMTALGWLLARADDAAWSEHQRSDWDLAEVGTPRPSGVTPLHHHSHRYTPEWLIRRIVASDPDLGTALEMWPNPALSKDSKGSESAR